MTTNSNKTEISIKFSQDFAILLIYLINLCMFANEFEVLYIPIEDWARCPNDTQLKL